MNVLAHSNIVIALAYISLTGCAATTEINCSPGQERAVSEMLYFGTAKPNGTVSAQEWSDFLRSAVTPSFPKGFTHWQARGQWRGKNGAIIQENSFVLTLIHPDDGESEKAARSIANEYKRRFQQEAVLRVKNVGCVIY